MALCHIRNIDSKRGAGDEIDKKEIQKKKIAGYRKKT